MPTRRQCLQSLVCAAMAPAQRPSIVYICSDQQRADDTGCLGGGVATPTLDRLAGEGAAFRNAFVQFPVCLPSRVSMWTGRYPHAHGVGSNEAKLRLTEKTLPELLRPLGYFAAATGVLEQELVRRCDEVVQTPALRPGPAPELGEMDRHSRSAVFTGDEGKHWDMRCLRAAQRILKSGPHPLFLSVNFHQPHGIVAPLARFARGYDPAKVKLPASYSLHGGRFRGRLEMSEAEMRTVLARRMASCEMVDSFVGEIISTIQSLGNAENTILVYQSDHGDYGGEFGLQDKSPTSLTDALLKVPLILWAPGRIAGRGVLPDLVEEVDVLPTLLELAGLPISSTVQGRSLMPVLQGRGETKQAVFAETGSQFESRMIRTTDWKLITRRSGESELYDLKNDRGETRNVFGHHPDVEDELTRQLRRGR